MPTVFDRVVIVMLENAARTVVPPEFIHEIFAR